MTHDGSSEVAAIDSWEAFYDRERYGLRLWLLAFVSFVLFAPLGVVILGYMLYEYYRERADRRRH
ncbi:hypothetical protein [Natronolimnobius baerhuensis]|uniref:Uncharacterized protein n=1 Tax=Natronolimnobius baerhuensis TaxID=253108 RepID=A0A202EBB8_9EURY|nr:hypothetical protein [Natronolimnobius baerhuensis]OVE85517.1 hypothetical protein B2G88_01450 [Natronolimnobius baerhuensis]